MKGSLGDIDNVVMFVGDAIRWDASREFLSSLGPTWKTVSASLHTPTSFTSMLTGRRPNEHQVWGFSQRAEDFGSVFTLTDLDASFGAGFMNDWLGSAQQILGDQSQRSLEEMEPPFLWVSRDCGGHAPYNGFQPDGQELDGPNAKEYLSTHAGDLNRLKSDYSDAVDGFERRVSGLLGGLEQRGLAESTLVIITSDHGELLGEYGQIGHDFPAVPELVYVPTTFVHPSLKPGEHPSGVVRHVDLYPTIRDALGRERADHLVGTRLFSEQPGTVGLCLYNRSFADFLRVGLRSVLGDRSGIPEYLPDVRYHVESVWDRQGGHVFVRSNAASRWVIFLLRLLTTPEGRHIRKAGTIRQGKRTLTAAAATYGNPEISKEQADEILDERPASADSATSRELDEEAIDRLRELGYL